jgi:hypothetical protein
MKDVFFTLSILGSLCGIVGVLFMIIFSIINHNTNLLIFSFPCLLLIFINLVYLLSLDKNKINDKAV